MVSSMLKHTLPFKSCFLTIGIHQHTKGVICFIAYCVTEFETVFCSLIFCRFLPLPPIASNKLKELPTKTRFPVTLLKRYIDDMNNCMHSNTNKPDCTHNVPSEDSNQLGHQSIQSDQILHSTLTGEISFCLACGFTSQSTSMVMWRRSHNLYVHT